MIVSQVIAELRESRIVGESSPVWLEEVWRGEGQRALGAMTRCRGDSARWDDVIIRQAVKRDLLFVVSSLTVSFPAGAIALFVSQILTI